MDFADRFYVQPDEDGIIDLSHLEDSDLEISPFAQQTIARAEDFVGVLAEYLERDRETVEEIVNQYFTWMIRQLAAGYIVQLPGPEGENVYLRINRDEACYRQLFDRLPEEIALLEIRYDKPHKRVPDHLRICPLGGDFLSWHE